MRAPLALAALALLCPAPAHALDTFTLGGHTLRLDITADTIAAYHGDNRNNDITDDHYGELLNRINVQLSWWKLVGAVRLDTATYFNAADPKTLANEWKSQHPDDPRSQYDLETMYWNDLRAVQRDAYWLGKSYLTFAIPELEITAGDSYVSLGRGLVLSMRKQDELAIDNTLLGGKVVGRLKYVNATLVAGVANPVRVDDTTGASLFAMSPGPGEIGEVPIFQSDEIFGGKVEGTWNGFALSAQGVVMVRPGEQTLDTSGIRGAKTVDVGGAALTVPLPASLGSLYVEGALEHYLNQSLSKPTDGYAIYATATVGSGPVSALIEAQHYRQFEPLRASIDTQYAEAFSFLQYSAPPTTENATTDTRFNYFDTCVTGGRARLNERVEPWLLVYGTFGYWRTWGEREPCVGVDLVNSQRDDVVDGVLGAEVYFDQSASHLFLSGGYRYDREASDGATFYDEFHVEVDISRAIAGPWSAGVETHLRRRMELTANGGEPWSEGEVYTSVRYAPWLVAALGAEFTGLAGYPPTYLNGTLTWKYRSDSSLQLFVGQQRGGLRCVSGVCKIFPPFEGVKLEWVQRY